MSFMGSLLSACILAAIVLTVSGCDSRGSSPVNPQQSTDSVGILSESRKLAVLSPASLSSVMESARHADMQQPIEFAKAGYGVVYIEPLGGESRVVHNGVAGKPYQVIHNLAISRDGKRFAFSAQHDEKMKRIVVDGIEGALFDDIGMPEFSPDGRHVLYSVNQGDITRLVVDNKVNVDYQALDGYFVVSSDSRLLAFSAKSPDGKTNQFIITDMSFKDKTVFDSCGDYFVGSDDHSRLAVVCSDGEKSSIRVIDFLTGKTISTSQISQGKITRLKLSADNKSFAYTTLGEKEQRYIGYRGREEMIPTGDEVFSDPLILSEPEGVGVIIGTVYRARLYRPFQKEKRQERDYGYIEGFVASRDGRHHAYIAVNVNEMQQHIVVNGKEGPKFDKIVAPVFSPDGRYLAYRARQSGKRFLVISDMKGNVIRQHRNYDMVFQPVFTDDGTSVAYGVLDGNEFWWKVEKL